MTMQLPSVAVVSSCILLASSALAGPPCTLPGVEISPPAPLNANATFDNQDSDSYIGLACAGGTCLAVWTRYFDGAPGNDIVVSRSTDDGVTWSLPVFVDPNAEGQHEQVYLAAACGDGAGNWVVAWLRTFAPDDGFGTDSDLFYSRSSDDGVTWSPAAPLNINAADDDGNESTPALAVSAAGTWIAVWSSSEPFRGIGGDNDILFTRSVDAGATWSYPAPLNASAATDGSSFDAQPTVAAVGFDSFVVAWNSNFSMDGAIGTDHDILARHSTDGGLTWLAETAANTDAVSDTHSDQSPGLAADQLGNVVLVWARNLASPGGAGIYSATSADGGATWNAPVLVNHNGNDSPGAGEAPVVAYAESGNWFTAWQSNNSYDSALNDDNDILVSVSGDAGQSWSRERIANTNAQTDADYLDEAPAIAATPGGDILVAWESDNSLNVTIAEDLDILFARLHPAPSTDCDASSMPDACEIMIGVADDADYDGVPDACQPSHASLASFDTVAVSGEIGPSGSPYNEMLLSVCASGPYVFFLTRHPYALSVWHDGVTELVALADTQAPGTPDGVRFSEIHYFAPDGAGGVVFTAELFGVGVGSTNDFGIWYWRDGVTSKVAREGDLATQFESIVFASFNALFTNAASPRVNSLGDVVFAARITGPGIGSDNEFGIWRWSAGALSLAVLEGTPAPGTAGVFAAFEHPRIDDNGRLAFRGVTTANGGKGGIWFGHPGALQLVALEGQSMPNMPGFSFSILSTPRINAAGQMIYKSTATASGSPNTHAIWLYDEGAATRIVGAGDLAQGLPGPQAFLTNVDPYLITPQGRVLFGGHFDYPGQYASFNSALWLERDGAFELVAREHQVAPGASGANLFGDFSSTLTAAVNNQEQLIFVAGGINFWSPNRGLQKLASSGLDTLVDGAEAEVLSASFTLAQDPVLGLTDEGHFSARLTISLAAERGATVENGFYLGSLPDAADFNNDGVVDGLDQASFCNVIGASEGDANYDLLYDLNGDGMIDHIDQALLNSKLDSFCPGDIVASATFQPPPDGLVDGADLAVLLGAWGDTPSCADLVTGATFQPPPDGVIDGADLAVLLGAWGACGR